MHPLGFSVAFLLPLLCSIPSALCLQCVSDDPSFYKDLTHNMLKADILHLIADLTALNAKTLCGDAGAFSNPQGIHVLKSTANVLQHQTAQICMANTDLIESTFMPVDQATAALQAFVDKCCTDSDECQGGSTEVDNLPGTNLGTKVQIDLFVQSSMDQLGTCLGFDIPSSSTVPTFGIGTGVVSAAEAAAALAFGSTIWSLAQTAAFTFGGRLPLATLHGFFLKAPVNPNFMTGGLGVSVDVEVVSDAAPEATQFEVALANVLSTIGAEGEVAEDIANTLTVIATDVLAGGAAAVGSLDDF